MDEETRLMAATSFGYGRWSARHWFLGPEQGMVKTAQLKTRVDAWVHLGSHELDDCMKFHHFIKEYRWHGLEGCKAQLQSTWGKLLVALMAYQDSPIDRDNRRNYQVNSWGRETGDTCVIELSGLAAHNLTIERDRESFLDRRIQIIRSRIEEYEPEFVVLYGKTEGCKRAIHEITKGAQQIKSYSALSHNTWRLGATLIAATPHPRWTDNGQWQELGKKLRLTHLSG